MLGIQVHWTTPYHGQAKPIERAFGDFCQRIATHPSFAGAWTGANAMNKPENYGARNVPLDTFLKVVETEIVAHNARLGRRSKVCDGRSFEQVFNESYSRAPISKATAEQLRMCMMAAETTCANRDGVITLLGNRYWSETVAQLSGQHIVARFDPQELHAGLEVYRLNGVYCGRAECLEPAGFNDTEAARDHARARNQWMRATKTVLDAERRMSTAQFGAQLPDLAPSPAPESKVVRPFRPRKPETVTQSSGEWERKLDEATIKIGEMMRSEGASTRDCAAAADWVSDVLLFTESEKVKA
jgi:hypothetical protein